MVKGYV
jgi:hypothetical protein